MVAIRFAQVGLALAALGSLVACGDPGYSVLVLNESDSRLYVQLTRADFDRPTTFVVPPHTGGTMVATLGAPSVHSVVVMRTDCTTVGRLSLPSATTSMVWIHSDLSVSGTTDPAEVASVRP